jgi:hypothetical protein
MNNQHSNMPDSYVSTIRSIKTYNSQEFKIEERTWHPKEVQEELINEFISELMHEWGVEQ